MPSYPRAVRRALHSAFPAWLIFAVGIPLIYELRPELHRGHLISFDLVVGTLILLVGALIIGMMEKRQGGRR